MLQACEEKATTVQKKTLQIHKDYDNKPVVCWKIALQRDDTSITLWFN